VADASFAIHGVGEAWLMSLRPPAFGWICGLIGIADNTAISNVEVHAYVALMKPCDGGNAFLKSMRGFELTRAKKNFFNQGLRAPFPSGRPSPRRRDSCRQRGAPNVIHRSSDAACRSLKTVETTPIKGADWVPSI
jgi:hypothetical protein